MKQERNAHCSCGSGKKYKHCCEASAGPPTPTEFSQLAFLHNSGRFPDAEQFARTLLKRYSASGELWKALGYSLGKQGKDAVSALRKAAAMLPADADVQAELGNVLNAQGKYDEARESYQSALRVAPGNALTHNNLATVLQEIGQTEEAVAHYRMALSIKPDYIDAHYNLAIALKKLGRIDEAITSYRSTLQLDPNDVDAYYNLGIALQAKGDSRLAILSYREALARSPQHADARNNLGLVLMENGELDEAINCFREIVSHQPSHADLALALAGAGRLQEASDYYQRALSLNPDLLSANRSYLVACLYDPSLTLDSLYDTLSRITARMSAGLRKLDSKFPQHTRVPKRKLRIGYVSSDFYRHPVGRNVLPILENHDRKNFEVYLYADLKIRDGMTERFESVASEWRSIVGMSDQDVAEMIRQDRVDILILLAGRFDRNRPLIAACRAAPVQVSFHDPVTSTLKEMDYLITDHGLSPRDIKEKFTERLLHLPTFYLHSAMADAPEVTALPALKKGHVTFCSFNNPAKINEKVVALWAKVLHAVPDSHLLLKYKNIFSNQSVLDRYSELFRAQGIAPERLLFVGKDELGKHPLARYDEADIALDTFPFTGSTTTFESLWMGVPVITLLGDHMVARWSGAMMRKLQLDELIADTEEEFVSVACRLAGDPDRLAALRASLRDRVSRSPLCDARRRTRHIERAYRWMWAKYCAQNAQ